MLHPCIIVKNLQTDLFGHLPIHIFWYEVSRPNEFRSLNENLIWAKICKWVPARLFIVYLLDVEIGGQISSFNGIIHIRRIITSHAQWKISLYLTLDALLETLEHHQGITSYLINILSQNEAVVLIILGSIFIMECSRSPRIKFQCKFSCAKKNCISRPEKVCTTFLAVRKIHFNFDQEKVNFQTDVRWQVADTVHCISSPRSFLSLFSCWFSKQRLSWVCYNRVYVEKLSPSSFPHWTEWVHTKILETVLRNSRRLKEINLFKCFKH